MGRGRKRKRRTVPWVEVFDDGSQQGGRFDEEGRYVGVVIPGVVMPNRTDLEEEMARMTDDKLRREIMLISRMHPRIEVFFKNGRGSNLIRRPLLEAEARRRGIDTGMKVLEVVPYEVVPCQDRDVGVVLLDDEYVQPERHTEKRDDPKAKELSSSDIKCLNPRVSLSSSVVNYYIEYIIRTKLCGDDYRDKFYIFNTFFYIKLEKVLKEDQEDNYSKLRRWWKDINIYHMAYLILPIYGNDHWSLIIICLPSKESNYGPIILHLDSLELHISSNIFDTVGRFLEKEWDYLRKNPPPNISISEAIWEDLPKNIQKEKVHVPQQTNEYDCGIFMLYYIEQFIRDAPERFTRDNIGMLTPSWFRSEDASKLRHRIRDHCRKEFKCTTLDEAATSDRCNP